MNFKYILSIFFSVTFSIPSYANNKNNRITPPQQESVKNDIDSQIKLASTYLTNDNNQNNFKQAIQLLDNAIKHGTPTQQMDAIDALQHNQRTKKKALKITKN